MDVSLDPTLQRQLFQDLLEINEAMALGAGDVGCTPGRVCGLALLAITPTSGIIEISPVVSPRWIHHRRPRRSNSLLWGGSACTIDSGRPGFRLCAGSGSVLCLELHCYAEQRGTTITHQTRSRYARR
jgi:hypothetical protein